MNKPINTNSLNTQSWQEREFDKWKELTSKLTLKPNIELEETSRYQSQMNKAMNSFNDWVIRQRPFCDISKAGLDRWEQEANERVMSNIDKLIDLENSRGYVIPIKCFCEGDIADPNFLLMNGITQYDFSVIKPDDDDPYTHTIVVLSYGRTFKVAIPFLTMKLIYFSLPTGANNS